MREGLLDYIDNLSPHTCSRIYAGLAKHFGTINHDASPIPLHRHNGSHLHDVVVLTASPPCAGHSQPRRRR